MKKWSIILALVVLGLSLSPNPAPAAGKDGQGMNMDHSQGMGDLIHESTIDGYQVAYRLLYLKDQKTHHMMAFINDPDGKKIEDAKTGFLVVGPDGAEQKVMAMGMAGAYGANLDLSQKGEYTVKFKAVAGDKKLLDEFKYQMK